MSIDILDLIRYFINNIFSSIIMLSFLSGCYKKAYKNKIIYLAAYLFIVISRTVIACVGIPYLNIIYALVIVNVVSILVYECKLKTCIVYNFAYEFVALFADIFTGTVLSAIGGKTINQMLNSHLHKYIIGILYCIVLFLMSRVLVYLIKKRCKINVQIEEIVFLFLISVSEIAMMLLITRIASDTMTGLYLILLACVFLIANLYIVRLIEKTTQNKELKYQLELLQRQSEVQYKYYQVLAREQEQTKKITHDVSRHIQVISGLYASGDFERATYYQKNFMNTLQTINGFNCNNKILGTIINSKISQAQVQGVKLELDIEDVNLDFIDNIDITVIFANLLDNAFEACENVSISERSVFIKLLLHNGVIALKVSNSTNESVNPLGKVFASTKAGHSGIGLSNVLQTVEKYKGTFSASMEENRFIVRITIPMMLK